MRPPTRTLALPVTRCRIESVSESSDLEDGRWISIDTGALHLIAKRALWPRVVWQAERREPFAGWKARNC
jgi:hypothetical protein